MRNPVERIESHYTHGIIVGFQKMRLEEGIDPHLLCVSRYARQLDEYYRLFAPEDILLLQFEDLRQDALAVVQKACRFLGLSDSTRFDVSAIQNTNRQRMQRFGKPVQDNTKLSEAQREAVIAALRDDLRRLRSTYGVDIERWGLDV
jgi:hypothetical protein